MHGGNLTFIVNFIYSSLSFSVWPLLPTHCKCTGILLHLFTIVIQPLTHTLTQTHTQKHTDRERKRERERDGRTPLEGDRPFAEMFTRQHVTFIRDRYPCSWRKSNPYSQQWSGRRFILSCFNRLNFLDRSKYAVSRSCINLTSFLLVSGMLSF